MNQQVNPLVGRAAALHEYSTSDLSVEEQLAGGASVDDLISAGVLYDDYDPENNPAYDFTSRLTVVEIAALQKRVPQAPPVSDEEFQADMQAHTKYSRLATEFRRNANRRSTWN